MPQTVLITGTGRPYALGFNLVKRYLEHGDTVFASIRRPSEALEELQRRLIPGRVFRAFVHIVRREGKAFEIALHGSCQVCFSRIARIHSSILSALLSSRLHRISPSPGHSISFLILPSA